MAQNIFIYQTCRKVTATQTRCHWKAITETFPMTPITSRFALILELHESDVMLKASSGPFYKQFS